MLTLVAPHWSWKKTKVRKEPCLISFLLMAGPYFLFSIGFTLEVVTQKHRSLFSCFFLLSVVSRFSGAVLLCFVAALGKMMEEIEINLPRFDQCIR